MRRERKAEIVGAEVTLAGREFQTSEHEREKARSPWVIVLEGGNRESQGSSRSKIALGKVEAKKGREIEGRGAVHAAEWQWTISAPTEAAIGMFC